MRRFLQHENCGGVSPTLRAAASNGAADTIPCVVLEGNSSRPSHKGDGYKVSDKEYTLNSVEIHGVAYRKTAHPTCSEEGQGWEETEKADTVNTFDNSEARTSILVVDMGGGKSGCGISEDITPTLACTHGGEPCIALDRAAYNQGQNARINANTLTSTLWTCFTPPTANGSISRGRREKSPRASK